MNVGGGEKDYKAAQEAASQDRISRINRLRERIAWLRATPHAKGAGGMDRTDEISQHEAELEQLVREEGNYRYARPESMINAEQLNKFFDMARSNLGTAQGQAVGQAQQGAGALAASRGMLNPAGFVTGVGSEARAPYAQAFGGLEQGRAGAQSDLQKLLYRLNAERGRMIEGDLDKQRNYGMSIASMQEQQRQWQDQLNANKPNALSYFSALVPLLTGGASLLRYLNQNSNKPPSETDYNSDPSQWGG